MDDWRQAIKAAKPSPATGSRFVYNAFPVKRVGTGMIRLHPDGKTYAVLSGSSTVENLTVDQVEPTLQELQITNACWQCLHNCTKKGQ